ncbi:MAG: peptide chain release factor N(5)-glutamine methyltransferase [Lachnospiraceae bacterium]|nr:peptide chain release factor N(5)-glutamine methyltransferase [Lachnospiraceae bacterium]
MNYRDTIRTGEDRLSSAGITEAALDARLLLEFITGHDRNTLFVYPDTPVSDVDAEKYEELIEKRSKHIPLQQLTGSCEFMGMDFFVNDKVLIPRQDSECLVEEAMRYVSDGSDILDLCTGSGCLLLSLMHYKNGCRGIGIDISADAVDVANINRDRLEETGGLNGGRADFIVGDLYDGIAPDRKFDVIISNPPYIRSADIAELMPEVRDHEPLLALDGGDDGLIFYRRIAVSAPDHLVRGGRIFLEIGYDQAEDVTRILAEAGFYDINVIKDFGRNDRVILARCAPRRV